MKQITSTESKKIMLDILDDVTTFCNQHSITYFLSCGTLIGAIRHQGFIPWDDDIDIMMPREDYNKYISLYRQTGKYTLSTPTDRTCFYLWTKAYDPNTIKIEEGIDYSIYPHIGIDIDIFPLDGLPDHQHNLRYKIATNYRNIISTLFQYAVSSTSYRTWKGIALIYFSRIIGTKNLKRLYINSAQKYAYKDSNMVGYCDPFAWKKYHDRHQKVLFESSVLVKFEGKSYCAPNGYDEYLSDIYGNYMQLPPVEQQITHHKNQIYWKKNYK